MTPHHVLKALIHTTFLGLMPTRTTGHETTIITVGAKTPRSSGGAVGGGNPCQCDEESSWRDGGTGTGASTGTGTGTGIARTPQQRQSSALPPLTFATVDINPQATTILVQHYQDCGLCRHVVPRHCTALVRSID